MRKLSLLALPLFLIGCERTLTNPEPSPSLAVATAPGQNKLQCFDGASDPDIFSGTCSLDNKGAKGSATLDLASGDADGDYAGVFTLDATVYGQLLTDITQMSYHYSGTVAPLPGNLSYNIPIDTNNDGTTEFFLFVDAFHCPGTNGIVDVINDDVCVMFEGGAIPHANWDAFLAAHPGAKVAVDNFVFIVAERTGPEPAAVWTVSNVKFGKAGK